MKYDIASAKMVGDNTIHVIFEDSEKKTAALEKDSIESQADFDAAQSQFDLAKAENPAAEIEPPVKADPKAPNPEEFATTEVWGRNAGESLEDFKARVIASAHEIRLTKNAVAGIEETVIPVEDFK